jgi:hypothetical protein
MPALHPLEPRKPGLMTSSRDWPSNADVHEWALGRDPQSAQVFSQLPHLAGSISSNSAYHSITQAVLFERLEQVPGQKTASAICPSKRY